MSNVALRLKIEAAQREISALQTKIEERVKEFTTSGAYYYNRDSAVKKGLERLYDEMVSWERTLGLAQQRLTSLLLELTTESIDRLDSSVKTVDSSVKILDSSVGSLSSLTRKVVKSSKTLEFLTSILIVAAIATISVDLLTLNPYYAIITGIAAFAVWVIIRRSARKEPKI